MVIGTKLNGPLRPRGRGILANTQQRSIRIDDEIWQAATERAADEERTVSDIVRIALKQYAEGRYDAIEKRRPTK